MLSNQKLQPAFIDTDLMPFGKHKDEPLQDVPAKYLAWLWDESDIKAYKGKTITLAFTKAMSDKVKLANYIHNSKEAIEQELGYAI